MAKVTMASKNAKTSKVKLTSANKIKTGDASKIAEKTGFSVSHVYNVLAGRRYNTEVITSANTLTKRRK